MSDHVNTPTLTEGLLEWWHVLVFMGTLVIGFILGNAKQRWTQDQQQERIMGIERRLSEMERSFNLDSRAVLVLQAEMAHIRSALVDIKNKLEA
jgi:hypothetical protein